MVTMDRYTNTVDSNTVQANTSHSINSNTANIPAFKLERFRDMSKRRKISILVRTACLVFLIILFVIVWNL